MPKFKSIKAFRGYEERSQTLDPFRVMSLLKVHPEGMRIGEISKELSADIKQVDVVVSTLSKKDMVKFLQNGNDQLITLAL